ncbi:MAG TPA: 50S ribosomal protein L13 [Lentisphaeria bacterium]|mgnify:FL=1|nr:50S ribosomal protein L13 [Lentisphaerota bacterium]OQC16284.1 MAG: 50S ribosomal protein L13 [Lentisphaerae bacterium ADurb.Bin082]HPY90893.1 50S ribosomal protein L13 [Lentisphaeria bacterium]HQC53439.1 50S ribosomal protein L13 [Lentisphaeria bacterium]HQL87683.1 50S ribosomal protein L13 [Lentisphaeria bacterium]
MKTFLPKENEITRNWYVIDATGQVLGRLAVQIANMLRGRHKPTYTPHLDCGDFIIVINAEKVVLTGDKDTKKIYEDYSGFTDGRKVQTADVVRAKNPTRLISDAVEGMMPKGRLGRAQFSKLKVYAGPTHPHEAQQAVPFTVK